MRLARRLEISHLPLIAAFISVSDRARDSAANREASSRCRPSVLVSRTPATDSDSSTSAVMPASWRWRPRTILRRLRPSRSEKTRNSGTTTRQTRASFHSMTNAATATAAAAITCWTVELAVFEMTLSTPPTSLAIRDCRSPARVRVKKRSDIRCRCSYTLTRRSHMTR